MSARRRVGGRAGVPALLASAEVIRRGALLGDEARSGGLMVWAPPGWGKSRLLGRAICHQDSLRRVGTVVLDVVGGTIDNALDKVLFLPEPQQREVTSRIRYCNMAGQRGEDGTLRVPAFPMLAPQSEHESLYVTSQRLVDLIARTDRALATASIQGLKRLAPLLTAVATVLAGLRLPISAADDLLRHPEAWEARLHEVAAAHPDAAAAVADLREFAALPERTRLEWSEPLRNRLAVLRLDPVARAMFCAPDPAFSWPEVAEKGLQVYIDLRFERSDQSRELKLFWVWNSLLEYIRSRSRTDPPLAVVIDELSFFVRGSSLNTDVICTDFADLVQVRKRNGNVWLTVATQEQGALPDEMLRACLQMGSQLYGATTEHETALRNARRWGQLDPYRVKHWRNVRASESVGGILRGPRTRHFVIDQEPEFFSLAEQEYLASRVFWDVPKESWLYAESPGEGILPRRLTTISTRRLDPGMYVNEKLVPMLRQRLTARDGVVVDEVSASLRTGAAGAERPLQDGAKVRRSITRRSPRGAA